MTLPPIAATIDKLQWVIQQYDALLPEGQAAVDAALVALPRRPVSELSRYSTVQAAMRLPPTATPSARQSSSD